MNIGKNGYVCLLCPHGAEKEVLGVVETQGEGILLAKEEAMEEERLFILAHNPGRGVGVECVAIDEEGKASRSDIGWNFIPTESIDTAEYDYAEHDECGENCPPNIKQRMEELRTRIEIGAATALKSRPLR